MSFFWQNAVAAQAQPENQEKSQWDYISLGGPPVSQPNYRWDQATQSAANTIEPVANGYEQYKNPYATTVSDQRNNGQATQIYDNLLVNGQLPQCYQQNAKEVLYDQQQSSYYSQNVEVQQQHGSYQNTIEHTPILPKKTTVAANCFIPSQNQSVTHESSAAPDERTREKYEKQEDAYDPQNSSNHQLTIPHNHSYYKSNDQANGYYNYTQEIQTQQTPVFQILSRSENHVTQSEVHQNLVQNQEYLTDTQQYYQDSRVPTVCNESHPLWNPNHEVVAQNGQCEKITQEVHENVLRDAHNQPVHNEIIDMGSGWGEVSEEQGNCVATVDNVEVNDVISHTQSDPVDYSPEGTLSREMTYEPEVEEAPANAQKQELTPSESQERDAPNPIHAHFNGELSETNDMRSISNLSKQFIVNSLPSPEPEVNSMPDLPQAVSNVELVAAPVAQFYVDSTSIATKEIHLEPQPSAPLLEPVVTAPVIQKFTPSSPVVAKERLAESNVEEVKKPETTMKPKSSKLKDDHTDDRKLTPDGESETLQDFSPLSESLPLSSRAHSTPKTLGASIEGGECQKMPSPVGHDFVMVEKPITGYSSNLLERYPNLAVRSSAIQGIRSHHLSEMDDKNSFSEMSDTSAKPILNRDSAIRNYRHHKKTYPVVLNRINMVRGNEVPMGNKFSNPIMEANADMFGRRSVLGLKSTTPLIPMRQDPREKLSASSYTNPDVSLDMILDTSTADDIMESSRKKRLARSRPASRAARSEVGENGSYREQDTVVVGGHVYVKQGAMGRNPHNYPVSGRRSTVGVPINEYYHHPDQRRHIRPHSTIDHGALARMERSGMPMHLYDSYTFNDVSSESGELQEGSEAEDEMRRIAMPPQRHYIDEVYEFSPKEIYYFGCLNLPLERMEDTMDRFPPPSKVFYQLTSEARVAYMYHSLLFERPYEDINKFYHKFNRDFFTHTADGKTEMDALYLICKELKEKHLEYRQQAYQKTQKQLFSDERDSQDEESRLSDRGSVLGGGADDDDIASVASVQRGPMKHRTPHAFVTFGPGGRMLAVYPEFSYTVVHINYAKNVLTDEHTMRIVDTAQIFKGPLIKGQTAPHSVGLYIRRQMDRIIHSDVAKENPYDNDVIDCLLIWQLLQRVVQQHGRVTGPDLAQLLIAAVPPTRIVQQQIAGHREKTSKHLNDAPACSDSLLHDKFTKYLLEGHIDEAIEYALHHGLYADAMVLSRRIGHRRLSEIEERFLGTRPQDNPVTTLVAVASNLPAPVLTNPQTDDGGSWRSHAAIVLANLSSENAMNTIYQLGRVLAKRDYHAAADFCLLAVALLSNFDPFQPVDPAPEDDPTARQHITLIHASLPDDDMDSTMCRFRFSLSDLHATEIFSYGLSLTREHSPLSSSVEFQRKRLQYAKLLSSYGGFETDAARYCLDIARSIWSYYTMLSSAELTELCDLADRLHVIAGSEPMEIQWIPDMRQMIAHMQSHVPQIPQLSTHVPSSQNVHPTEAIGVQLVHHYNVPPTQEVVTTTPQYYEHQQFVPELVFQQTDYAPITESHHEKLRERTASISSEAADWHSGHQEPIQIGTPTDRRNSMSSQTSTYGPPTISYGEQLCQAANKIHVSQILFEQESSSSKNTSSADASSEGTPVRQVLPLTPEIPVYAAPPPMPVISQAPPTMSTQPTSAPLPQPSKPHPTTEPVCQQNDPSFSTTQQPNTLKKSSSATGSSKGLFGRLKDSMLKAIPSNNEMILPDDSSKTIVWDPVAGRYVGDGVEPETVAAPPPMLDTPALSSQPPLACGGGLKAARISGGSRYFNPLNAASNSPAPSVAAPIPTMLIPTSFGFIPTMPDTTDDVIDSPFSTASADSLIDSGQHTEN